MHCPTIDENAPITQGDIDTGTLVLRKRAAGGSVVLPKKRVTLYLDATLVERFKDMAGDRGYPSDPISLHIAARA